MDNSIKMRSIILYGAPTIGEITAIENTETERKVEFGAASSMTFRLSDGTYLKFGELKSRGITATITPKYDDIDGFVILTLKIDVPENITVDEISFGFPKFKIGRDDCLMLPYEAGMRYKNPAKALFTPVKYRSFDWKDRRAGVNEGGLMPANQADATIRHQEVKASMQFADYYTSEGFGLYLGTNDKGFENTSFAFSAERGDDRITLAMRKMFNRHLDSWKCDFVIGLHEGDWHVASDYYREFFDTTGLKIRHSNEASPGMSCHYDLLWQNGDINHYYRDLPEVARIARSQGFDTLLCAGWHNGGFDTNYPDFRPDPKLGTEEEFIEAVRQLHADGSKIYFYINAYSFDHEYSEYEEFGRPAAVKRDDEGTTIDVRWGTRVLTAMCTSSEWWREKVLDNVRYITQVIGADGVYLDQLNIQPPTCHDKNHVHDRSAILSNIRLATEARERFGEKVVLLSEWAFDAMASVLDFQLIQTIWQSQEYSYPEFFRYTFPTAGTVDMILQKPWGGTDPTVEGRFIRDVFDRLFVSGIKFWCYDHVAYAPGFEDYFKSAIELRNRFEDEFNDGVYLDDIELEATVNGVSAKTFALGDKRMLTVANRTGLPQTVRFKDGRAVDVSDEPLSILVI